MTAQAQRVFFSILGSRQKWWDDSLTRILFFAEWTEYSPYSEESIIEVLSGHSVYVGLFQYQCRVVMGSKLVITLDEEATRNYLARAGEIAKAHADADCEPPGVVLSVEIAPIHYDSTASIGNIQLGVVTVKLTD